MLQYFSRLVKRSREEETQKAQYGWFGDYATWEDAKKDSTGYSEVSIIEKVYEATLKVKSGEAVCERDSVLFDQIEYSWPLTAGLMRCAARNQGSLRVLDFGGALGSAYFQNRLFLQGLRDIQWSVVEQAAFVRLGKEGIADDRLRFYDNIESCISETAPRVLILSGVLQYLPEPYEMLNTLLKHDWEAVIVDRTGFSDDDKERLTVQRVPPHIYSASYPCWFFSSTRFLAHFNASYRLLADFITNDTCNLTAKHKGYIFEHA